MNPITEEVGSTARALITSLKDPMALTLIVSNLILLGFIFYTQIDDNRARSENTKLFADKITDCVARDLVDKIVQIRVPQQ